MKIEIQKWCKHVFLKSYFSAMSLGWIKQITNDEVNLPHHSNRLEETDSNRKYFSFMSRVQKSQSPESEKQPQSLKQDFQETQLRKRERERERGGEIGREGETERNGRRL